jgi:PAS domain S-box-containing protein
MTQKNQLKILFAEDLPSDAELAVMELRKEGFRFEHIRVDTRSDFNKALKEFSPDIVISDYMMPTFNGLQALQDTREFDPLMPFILFTGSINEEIAVKCMKEGATDYIIKEHMTRLPFAVKEALDQFNVQAEKRAADLLLKESEEKIQSIFRAAPVGIGLVVDRIFMEVNDTFCEMTGYTRKELIGNHAEMIYPSKEISDYVGEEKYRQISEKGTGSIETFYKSKNGRILNVLMSSTPLDRSDLSKGVTFTVLDITDRHVAEEALKLSEEKFRSIADNLTDVIFLTDREGIITYISPSCTTFGYTTEEFLGTFFGQYLADGEIEKAFPVFMHTLTTGDPTHNLQLMAKRKEGSCFFAELNGSVLVKGNEIVGILGLIRDITERVKNQTDLHKLSSAVEQSSVSIIITDEDGIIEYANPKFCEISGFSREELIGENPSMISSGEKSKEEYAILWNTIKGGRNWIGEFKNKKKNGEYYWENASISPIKSEKGVITHFLGIKEDITEKKKMEAAVKASEQRYRELFLNNPVPTYIFDTDTLEFVEVNEATVQNYGYSREEFAKMTLKDVRIPEEIPDLIESVRELGNDVFNSVSMRHRKKDGTVFPVEINSHSLPEKNGRKTRLVMTRDITERLKAAEQMKIAREKAEASDNLKTTFLNNISHEVRTPLNGILGFAEIMAQQGLTEDEKRESLAMLFESSDRLLDTITCYMDISLLTSGSMAVNKKDFSPGKIIAKVLDGFKLKCSERHLELLSDIPEHDSSITASSDPEIIQKILNHLLNNAIKFTGKGSVSVGYVAGENDLEFFVKDTGIGIGKESIGIIFDQFVKEERGPLNPTEGSGLGLSITKGLVELLGGKIRVESEKAIGTSFYFTIPCTGKLSSDQGKITNEGKATVHRKNVILVAEDDETNFFYLRALLKQNTTAEVIHALNGKEAVDFFMENPDIGLILMDIKMPVMNGLEATRIIKAVSPGIPIIAITAYAMAGDETRILDAGCDHYLTKPIDKKQLLSRIAEFIEL